MKFKSKQSFQTLVKIKHELLLVSILLCESELTGGWRQTAGVAAIKPPQKKRTQRDDIIQRAPVKAQMMENHVDNMMEIGHFCFMCSYEEGSVSSSLTYLYVQKVKMKIKTGNRNKQLPICSLTAVSWFNQSETKAVEQEGGTRELKQRQDVIGRQTGGGACTNWDHRWSSSQWKDSSTFVSQWDELNQSDSLLLPDFIDDVTTLFCQISFSLFHLLKNLLDWDQQLLLTTAAQTPTTQMLLILNQFTLLILNQSITCVHPVWTCPGSPPTWSGL